jgi:RimJ/RimL family protein N-acetyltransferase
MNLQPTLENDIVRIRPLDSSDLEPLYQVAKDPKIWDQHLSKRYIRKDFEIFFSESIKCAGALTIVDKASESIIGSSRYKEFDRFRNMVEIGWTFLDRAYWGGKYNKAIKRLMIDHAFDYVNTIVFFVDKNNIRSLRAIEKIGGQRIVESRFEKFPETSSENLTFIVKNKKASK